MIVRWATHNYVRLLGRCWWVERVMEEATIHPSKCGKATVAQQMRNCIMHNAIRRRICVTFCNALWQGLFSHIVHHHRQGKRVWSRENGGCLHRGREEVIDNSNLKWWVNAYRKSLLPPVRKSVTLIIRSNDHGEGEEEEFRNPCVGYRSPFWRRTDNDPHFGGTVPIVTAVTCDNPRTHEL